MYSKILVTLLLGTALLMPGDCKALSDDFEKTLFVKKMRAACEIDPDGCSLFMEKYLIRKKKKNRANFLAAVLVGEDRKAKNKKDAIEKDKDKIDKDTEIGIFANKRMMLPRFTDFYYPEEYARDSETPEASPTPSYDPMPGYGDYNVSDTDHYEGQ